MLTRALISSGCWGDGGHQQRLDVQNFNNLPDLLVLRRSVPHAGGMPDVEGWRKTFDEHGYAMEIVKIRRDPQCTAESMMKRGHANNRGIAQGKVQRGNEFLDKHDGMEISYRRFVTDGGYRAEKFTALGLPAPEMEFFNGDAKYL